MSEQRHSSSDIWWEAREFIQDRQRAAAQPEDSKAQKAARQYLKSRLRRIDIERQMGSKIDAFPFRLVEVMRAYRLVRAGQFGPLSKEEKERWLPTYARTLVDKAPNLPQQ
jgi:hypothetical protein